MFLPTFAAHASVFRHHFSHRHYDDIDGVIAKPPIFHRFFLRHELEWMPGLLVQVQCPLCTCAPVIDFASEGLSIDGGSDGLELA